MVRSWKIICLQHDEYFYFLLWKYYENPVTFYFYVSKFLYDTFTFTYVKKLPNTCTFT